MSTQSDQPGPIVIKPVRVRKGLKIGFNGFAAIFQLILIAILAADVFLTIRQTSGVFPRIARMSAVSTIELQMILELAGATAGILLVIGLPLFTLSALLGMRKRYGAARPADQPRKLLTWDSLSLLICVFLLSTPVALFFIALVIAG